MTLPFSRTDFFAVFAAYNTSFTWLPVLTYLAGIATLAAMSWKSPNRDRAVAALLGLFWLWNGAVYHIVFFRAINPAAAVFGILFVLQGALFLNLSRHNTRLRFGFERSASGIAGLFFVAYALVLYPLIGFLLGRHYPEIPIFGMAPCPTTIFTFGLLMNTRGPLPLRYLVIPLLWSLVGFSAAVQLRVWEDLGLTAAGLTAAILIILRNRSMRNSVQKAVAP